MRKCISDRAARHDAMAEMLAGLLLAAAFLCGGGSRGLGDLVVTLVALPVVFVSFARWSWSRQSGPQRAMWVILVASAGWCAVQLVPLPESWFGSLPMRSELPSDLRKAGVDVQWLAATLDRWGTTRALVSLAVFASLWCLLSTISPDSKRRLIRLCVMLGCAMAALGFAQATAGRYSQLRLYDYHHPVGALGTFANRNHFACLMAMLLPLAVALAIEAQRGNRRIEAALAYVAAAMLLLASGLSFSRTGFVLTCLSAVSCLALVGLQRRKEMVAGALLAVASVALISVYAWSGISARLQQDPLKDLRWQYLHNGWEVAKAYFPWGSGPGTFRYVYAPFEPASQVREVFALHAHNDFLEIAIESGLFGVVLMLAAACVLIHAVRNKLIVARDESPIILGSVVAVAVPMLHSIVDYPLRTFAVMAMLALVLSVVLPGSGRGVGKAA